MLEMTREHGEMLLTWEQTPADVMIKLMPSGKLSFVSHAAKSKTKRTLANLVRRLSARPAKS